MALLLFVAMGPRPTEARLHPYYVLTGASFGQINPRILFVVDTSGSMVREARGNAWFCRWTDCEDASDHRQSRIAAARKAIRHVVQTHEDRANFALMTFDMHTPPRKSNQVPRKCRYSNNDYRRFFWVPSYRGGSGGYMALWNRFGYRGQWTLCGDNRPYPYLRWDDLGVKPKITSNNQTGPVPSSPLHSANQSDFSHPANSHRKVQWFPAFMGVRVNLNPTTDPSRSILGQTYGDYGNNGSDRNVNVWRQDFYYWPYVDGFPGYSQFRYQSGQSGHQQLGYQRDDPKKNRAALLSPFFLPAAVNAYATGKRGPLDADAAKAQVQAFTDHIERGGMDASGGTPWKNAIGKSNVNPPKTNAELSHTTVASYLKFAQNIDPSDICVPQIAVLITDGDPSNGQGGAELHRRLSDLRNKLNTKTYVIGFNLASRSLNDMACASAGSSNAYAPCSGTPTKQWDTCNDATDPAKGCAWLATTPDELAGVIATIVEGELGLEVPSGPGATINDLGANGSGDIYQSSVSARTEWPAWKGHVERSACTTMVEDPPGSGTMVLAPECAAKPTAAPEATFGPCPQSTTWDAGECLKDTDWRDRRIYVNDANNVTHPIYDRAADRATPAFRQQLNDPALAVPGAPFSAAEADAIARFVQGKDWKDGWKLPGLASSAPIVIRRIPPPDTRFSPQVLIRDPHCAGRTLSEATDVDQSLVDFAAEANDDTLKLQSPAPHFEYQEAVLVGDDLGLIHAFQYESGNEIFALLPRFLLHAAVESYGHGGLARGQPDELEDHVYGAAGTVNHGWVYDSQANAGQGGWRHLAVMGMGRGGPHFVALDVSHMSPSSPRGPVEVLWTTDDAALRPTYATRLGETWARPALSYRVPNDLLSSLPEAYLVMSSGYPVSPGGSAPTQGRHLMLVDALTGAAVEDVILPAPASGQAYDSEFGSVTDPAVGTYCVSRYWGEMQETYVSDPAGRLYRWDLGRETAHASDSDGPWGGTARPAATFPACSGVDDFSCSVTSANKGDVFVYPPAVVAKDRIDDAAATTGALPDSRRNQFLVAMVSGSPHDDAIDGGDPANDFHSSLYVLADDHRTDKTGGFDIPNGAPKSAAGVERAYFRLALSDLERTRVYTPYPGSPTYTETRRFSRRARPVRAPRINVSQLLSDPLNTPNDPSDDVIVNNAEAYTITFTVYEPGVNECSAKWYDPVAEEFIFDEGATYEITLLVGAEDGKPFDFRTAPPSGGMGGLAGGLQLRGVTQVTADDCADGVCGPQLGTQPNRPCDGATELPTPPPLFTMPMSTSEIDGFNAVEG